MTQIRFVKGQPIRRTRRKDVIYLNIFRSELAGRGQGAGEGGRGSGDPVLEVEISEHSQAIQEIKAVLEFQVSSVHVQTAVTRTMQNIM